MFEEEKPYISPIPKEFKHLPLKREKKYEIESSSDLWIHGETHTLQFL